VPPTVVIAPDSFKGSLGASAVAEAIAHGWRSVRPDDELVLLPQADGGEGTIDAIERSVPGAVRHAVGPVTGPDGRPTPGEWLELPGGVAVVELAQSSGLPLMLRPDAAGATTRGLGEAIRAALDSGIRSLVIALGGSASTDGGAGALAALGMGLLDSAGLPIREGGAGLIDIASIDRAALMTAPTDGVTLWTDVTAPLTGETGAAAVFGPQKGATPEEVTELDRALEHFATLLGGDPSAAGAGAAGGTAYGFTAAWGATIRSGAEAIADLTGLTARLATADLILTGEGRFDEQSHGGKVVGHALRQASTNGVRAAVIAGQLSAEPGVWAASLSDLAGSPETAIREPERWLVEAGARAARELGRTIEN
jgi:glycerate kinase